MHKKQLVPAGAASPDSLAGFKVVTPGKDKEQTEGEERKDPPFYQKFLDLLLLTGMCVRVCVRILC